MAALHGARQRLEANIIGAAVAAEGDELIGAVDLALLLQRPVSGLHARAGGGGILEGVVDEAVLPGGVGISKPLLRHTLLSNTKQN